MGAGDVKLLAGVGAWVYGTHTVYAFAVSAIVGARAGRRHGPGPPELEEALGPVLVILNEIMVIRNPEQLAAIAAERKPTMLLLPYGIPIAIGTIGYFVWTGMLV